MCCQQNNFEFFLNLLRAVPKTYVIISSKSPNKKNPMFTHLHVHTEYSLLDGLCRISQLIAKAKELGMTSLAITDHGSMHGVIEFYIAAKEAGIKPIIGCETYVAETSRLNRNAGDKTPHHLVL